jgi:hypothetical protein
MRALALLLVPLLIVPPAASAAPGQPTLYLLHDVPGPNDEVKDADVGYTYVGNLNQFGYVLLDAQGRPTVHKDGVVRVVQNDIVLYETTLTSGHDYDALNTFQIAFPTTGPYTVYGEVPASGSVKTTAEFHGFVHPLVPTTNASVDVDVKLNGRFAAITIQVLDAEGNMIPHSDAILEIRRPGDNWLVFRTHLHTHSDPMKAYYQFQQDGLHEVRVIGYNAFPTPDGDAYAPVVAKKAITVSGGLSSGDHKSAMPPAKGGDRYKLLTSVDPQAYTTPWSRFVLSALVYDAELDRFLPHVNYVATLTDPNGAAVFDSASLHEYDGVFDLTANLPAPGNYVLKVAASQGDWTGHAEVPITVSTAIPAGPPAVGHLVVRATGLDRLTSGEPKRIQFAATSPLGTPATHSEIDYQIRRDGVPVLQNKIHTHGTGTFQVDITFPDPGAYELHVDPVTIHGEVTPFYSYGQPGGRLTVPLTVAVGVPLPAIAPPTEEAPALGSPRELPGFEIALLFLAALFVLRRRR